jgi:dethiobiotin synthetase
MEIKSIVNHQYIVTGTHTGIGKTLVSAILCLGIGAKYWKPIQTGSVEGTDSLWLAERIGAQNIFPESYCLKKPESPHSAAAAEGILLSLSQIQAPFTSQPLIIEGAGGVMVPINREHIMLDVFQRLQRSVIVVAGMYLGTINHTLLTFEALRYRKIPIAGVIFSGDEQLPVIDIILHYSKAPFLGHIPQLNRFDAPFLTDCFTRYINKDVLEQAQ